MKNTTVSLIGSRWILQTIAGIIIIFSGMSFSATTATQLQEMETTLKLSKLAAMKLLLKQDEGMLAGLQQNLVQAYSKNPYVTYGKDQKEKLDPDMIKIGIKDFTKKIKKLKAEINALEAAKNSK